MSEVVNVSLSYESGLQYRTINKYRSALSSTLLPIEGVKVGDRPLICWLLKGVFNQRPLITKLVPSWSVKNILEVLQDWSPLRSLDLKTLTLKIAMLLELVTSKRCSSLVLLSLTEGYCDIQNEKIHF